MLDFFKLKKKNQSNPQNKEFKVIIGEYHEGDYPIVVRFVNELPSGQVISHLSWFTVISWKYDGSERNGMPTDDVNKKMIELEDALTEKLDENAICQHAYNRTGNSLKEFNYYISDRDEFMVQFNQALKGHVSYPIEISFYEDPEWIEKKKIIADFKKK
jgi:hypothetical protein